MNTSRHHHDSSITDSTWDFLAEFPLNELLIDMDIRDSAEAGSLYQAVKGMGVRAELLDIIEGKLTVFATGWWYSSTSDDLMRQLLSACFVKNKRQRM